NPTEQVMPSRRSRSLPDAPVLPRGHSHSLPIVTPQSHVRKQRQSRKLRQSQVVVRLTWIRDERNIGAGSVRHTSACVNGTKLRRHTDRLSSAHLMSGLIGLVLRAAKRGRLMVAWKTSSGMRSHLLSVAL